METNTTDKIDEIILEVRREVFKSEDLLPERAAELLVKLASLQGNISDKIREAEMLFNQELWLAIETDKTVAKAKARVQAGKVYGDVLKARGNKDIVTELIRSLKFFLKSKESEFQYSGHQ